MAPVARKSPDITIRLTPGEWREIDRAASSGTSAARRSRRRRIAALLASKLAWTLVSAVPLLRPLLYAGVHDPPPVQPEIDRARGRGVWGVPHDPHP